MRLSKIRDIVFIVVCPLCERDFRRFGIELLEKNGFNVKVWDITAALYPEVSERYIVPDPVNWQGCRVFDDISSASFAIARLDNETLIVTTFHYLRDRYHIWKAISDSKAEYVIYAADNFNIRMDDSRKTALFYLKKLKHLTLGKFLDRIFPRLPLSLIGIKPARLVLIGGRDSIKNLKLMKNGTEVICAHASDYDLYLKEKATSPRKSSTAVFLDGYMPFHINWTYANIDSPVKPENYYPLLNRFFDRVEKELNFKVIIAAHPRSDYKNLIDYFKGRECVIGNTVKLVKEADLILSHHSAALNFANLFYKPVCFITTRELNQSFKGASVRIMAGLFGKKPIFIDEDKKIDWTSELSVTRAYYDNYRNAYIKVLGSEEDFMWQIFSNKLKED